MINAKILRNELRLSAIYKEAFMQNRDRVVELEMILTMSNIENNALRCLGYISQEVYNLVLRLRVKAARDFVAQKNAGVVGQLHGEPESPFLPS
jgi:hypothetical protein